ncbi:MAG: hypothetical protein JST26_11685 [Bacteroidetes bacterium]|nr:hypothetical protein [Bacteroidota bacterium]
MKRLIIKMFLLLPFLCVAQSKKEIFKFDLKYVFHDINEGSCIKMIRLYHENLKTDSTFFYEDCKNKLYVHFTGLRAKASCHFVLIDSLNNQKIAGSFINGMTLLKDQNDAFTVSGTEAVVLRNYYEGIADGLWVYSNLNGAILKERVYRKECINRSN